MPYNKKEYIKQYMKENITRVSLSFHNNVIEEMSILDRFNDYCNNTKQKKNDVIIDAIREYLNKYDR